MHTKQITYNDTVVRQFILASVFWGLVGLLAGLVVASQLAFWQLNTELPWLTFGRLRPLHTNAVIFAFVGNMMFAGIYYSTQRLVKARLASDLLSRLHFWGWQLIIVAAAITLPLGLTQGKEYAELEWPIDILIALVWVIFAVNFFWTLARKNEKNLYVAIWFYIATIITVAVLHIVNSLSLPVGLFKSYSLFAGVQDALVQWWYGHNAVAFFLTTPILGIMYYFMPKAIGRPVYSYKLSIIHFWSLIFMYIWAGPHHLLYSALPDWAQTLGVVFSVALWAPSWGGMINGLLTLRGAWHKLRTDPVVQFFAAAVTFYGMATFEGPLMSIKSVNALAHNTDWVVGHVHGGALGWNGFMAAGMFYWLIPRLYGTKLYSEKMARLHFWLGTFGILLYMASMYAGGLTQGLMWRALNENGTLMYPNFLESIFASRNMYMIRIVGGLMYYIGFALMARNLLLTMKSGAPVDGRAEVLVANDDAVKGVSAGRLIFSPTILFVVIGLFLLLALGSRDAVKSFMVYAGLGVFAVALFVFMARRGDRPGGHPWHEVLEGKPLLLTVFVLFSILIGGAIQIIPSVTLKEAVPMRAEAKPYTPLELVGRDIYIREGCYNCHTQMVRTLAAETLRYGAYSEAWESQNDHPFQWGSKRTGPDLARLGGKYPDLWHYRHMLDPRSTSPGSIMPSYPFLEDAKYDVNVIAKRMAAMKKLGVKYSDEDIARASSLAASQAMGIVAGLKESQVELKPQSELTALIAYLQKLGKDRKEVGDDPRVSQTPSH